MGNIFFIPTSLVFTTIIYTLFLCQVKTAFLLFYIKICNYCPIAINTLKIVTSWRMAWISKITKSCAINTLQRLINILKNRHFIKCKPLTGVKTSWVITCELRKSLKFSVHFLPRQVFLNVLTAHVIMLHLND